MQSPNTLVQKLADYKEYHLNKNNQLTHFFGIPLVLLGGFALFAQIHIGSILGVSVNGAVLALVVMLFLYFRMSKAALRLMLLPLIALALAAHFISLWPALAVFVAGWVFQFLGHAFEGRSPAFFRNLEHLLIGPLWVVLKCVPTSLSAN